MKNKQPSLTLINQASLTEKEDFQHVGLKSINLLFCSNPAISVPRSSKLVILCIAALTYLNCKKLKKTLNLSSALQIPLIS